MSATSDLIERLHTLKVRAVDFGEGATDNSSVANNGNTMKEDEVARKAQTQSKARTTKRTPPKRTATKKAEVAAPSRKRCSRCGKTRKIDQFYKDKTVKDGHSIWCKSCQKDYDKGYRERLKASGVSKLADVK